jgi:DNA-binding transcriptional ArsR family regulator
MSEPATSQAVDVFDAIASPVRRILLDALVVGPAPVHALAAGFTISRPAVSQHLRVLKDAGLVSEERVGKERRYRLNPVPLRQVDSCLSRYESFWDDRLGALRGLLDEQ